MLQPEFSHVRDSPCGRLRTSLLYGGRTVYKQYVTTLTNSTAALLLHSAAEMPQRLVPLAGHQHLHFNMPEEEESAVCKQY